MPTINQIMKHIGIDVTSLVETIDNLEIMRGIFRNKIEPPIRAFQKQLQGVDKLNDMEKPTQIALKVGMTD